MAFIWSELKPNIVRNVFSTPPYLNLFVTFIPLRVYFRMRYTASKNIYVHIMYMVNPILQIRNLQMTKEEKIMGLVPQYWANLQLFICLLIKIDKLCCDSLQ